MTIHDPHLVTAGDPALAPSDDVARARAIVAALDDDAQRPVRDQILRFVDEHPDALLRSCAPGHLTGSALVVDPSDERILVLHHRKLRKWLQPGGHADGDANLVAVALREATEETGIDGLVVLTAPIHVDVHLVSPPHETPHLHHDVRFLVLAPPGAHAAGNHESTALRWVSFDELVELADEEGLVTMARIGLDACRRLDVIRRWVRDSR